MTQKKQQRHRDQIFRDRRARLSHSSQNGMYASVYLQMGQHARGSDRTRHFRALFWRIGRNAPESPHLSCFSPFSSVPGIPRTCSSRLPFFTRLFCLPTFYWQPSAFPTARSATAHRADQERHGGGLKPISTPYIVLAGVGEGVGEGVWVATVHTDDPATVDVAHVRHSRDPLEGEYVPAGHCMHVLAPLHGAYVPGLHGLHAACPPDAEYVPFWHGVHAVDPEAWLYVPGGHVSHVDDPFDAE
jgi:hypothetical protein